LAGAAADSQFVLELVALGVLDAACVLGESGGLAVALDIVGEIVALFVVGGSATCRDGGMVEPERLVGVGFELVREAVAFDLGGEVLPVLGEACV